MSRPNPAAKNTTPATVQPSPGFVLPRHYSPAAAGYARGPFITPTLVTPTDWRWRNARTYNVTAADGKTVYRCVLVTANGKPVGYWAVEKLGEPLPLREWEEKPSP